MQELQAKQATLIEQAAAVERRRWEEASRTLAQRFEKAAAEERTLALKEADDTGIQHGGVHVYNVPALRYRGVPNLRTRSLNMISRFPRS